MQHYEKCLQIIATTEFASETRSFSPLPFFFLAILVLPMIDIIKVDPNVTN